MGKKYKIGYTTGVYDMFHIGHLNILRRAKEQCDYLIVGVSTDEVVQEYKHKTPIIPYENRAAIVAAIKYVDEVVPQTTMDKVGFLKERHFDVMFHGDEWKGTELYNKYEEEFAKYGAKIEYLSHTDGISSSLLREIINDKK
jgi:glycerol-3-phosphate cytidylyltransferase